MVTETPGASRMPLYNAFIILMGITIAGFGVVFFLYLRLSKKIERILGDAQNIGADQLTVGGLMRHLAQQEQHLRNQDVRIGALEDAIETSIRKVGFVRFNPFQNTGGDNSFILILLDGSNNGVMLSSLYMREGIRIYAKAIEQGRSRHPMSEEEKKALEETISKGVG